MFVCQPVPLCWFYPSSSADILLKVSEVHIAFSSWTSCPVITKQNVFYPSAWSLVTCSPFKISPGTLVFDVAKTNQFSALRHLKRILAAVCSLARRSAAPPKGMEREDGICDLTTLHVMSCLTALHKKKKLKLISSIN